MIVRQTAVVCVLLSSAVLAQDKSPLDLANAPVPPGAVRVTYGSDPLQFGELRVPATGGPHPVAIVVHGGCWLSAIGKMDPRAVALDNMRPLAAALTRAGVATWNIEYRRLGHSGGGWPGTFQDIGQAADALRGFAGEHRLDLARVIAIGHSAGGHFATWLAARARIPASSEISAKNPLKIAGVVNLDGPADLRATLPLQQPICGRPVVTELVGATPEERPARYREASPAEMLPLGVPQDVFAGRMFASLAAPYEAAATKAGDVVRTVVLPSAGHFVFIDPESSVWPDVLKSVRRLLSLPD